MSVNGFQVHNNIPYFSFGRHYTVPFRTQYTGNSRLPRSILKTCQTRRSAQLWRPEKEMTKVTNSSRCGLCCRCDGPTARRDKGKRKKIKVLYMYRVFIIYCVFFSKIRKYSGLWPFSVFPRRQCVYTHRAGTGCSLKLFFFQ